MKQEEIADAVGVSQGTVSNWEKGKKAPTSDQLQQLASVLELDMLVLIQRRFGICDEVEEAILQSDRLTLKEQDALLAAYGALAGRDSMSKVAFFRSSPGPQADQDDEVDQLLKEIDAIG
jgi:transcriptional regulator with XRE-family HTH domain